MGEVKGRCTNIEGKRHGHDETPLLILDSLLSTVKGKEDPR
jgi:hypothetical protein